MKSISNSIYDVTQEGTTIILSPKGETARQTLVFLPGWAESATTWAPYFLKGKSTPRVISCCQPTLKTFLHQDTKIVLLTAPIRYNKLYGRKGTAWFETYTTNFSQEDPHKVFNVEHVNDSVDIVCRVLDNEVKALGGDSRKCFIGGFSAGGSLASMAWKTYKKPLGGLVLYSAASFKPFETTKEQENSSIFWAHGLDDCLVPYKHGIYNNKPLEDGKRRFVHITRDGLGHGVDRVVEMETRRFLEDIMRLSKLQGEFFEELKKTMQERD